MNLALNKFLELENQIPLKLAGHVVKFVFAWAVIRN